MTSHLYLTLLILLPVLPVLCAAGLVRKGGGI